MPKFMLECLHLAARAWDLELHWRSASTFGLVIEWVGPLAIFAAVFACIRCGWFGMAMLTTGLLRDLAKTTAVTVGVLVGLAVVVFMAAIPVTIYFDHQALVERIKNLHNEKERIVSDNNSLRAEASKRKIPRTNTTASKPSAPMTDAEMKDFGHSTIVEMEDLYQDVSPTWETVRLIRKSNSVDQATIQRFENEIETKIKVKWAAGLGDRCERLRFELAKRGKRDSFIDNSLKQISLWGAAYDLSECIARFKTLVNQL
jgi:hypothetical protein